MEHYGFVQIRVIVYLCSALFQVGLFAAHFYNSGDRIAEESTPADIQARFTNYQLNKIYSSMELTIKDVAVDKFDIAGREFYQETFCANSEHPRLARIYYNSDGSIDETHTYCEWYIEEVLHPATPAQSPVKPAKRGKEGAEKVDGLFVKILKIIGRILLWPFKALG